MFQHIGEIITLFWRTLQALPLCWRHRGKIVAQLFEIGNVSLLMVCILSLFIAGVVALQTGPVMVSHGLGSVVGGMIGLSMCKEFAPVMMSILIAGRIGSAMAAEIGAMRVYSEIDALRIESDPSGTSLHVIELLIVKNDSQPPRTQFSDHSFDFYLPDGAVLGDSDAVGPGSSAMPLRIQPTALRTAETWIARRRAGWERRLDRLGEFLAAQDTTSDKGR